MSRSASAAPPRPSAGALLRLARWPNALLAGSGVLAGAWWAGGDVAGRAAWLAVLSAAALTAVANATNDIADVAIDRTAHPERPLPRGELTVRHAAAVAVAAALLGVVAGTLARPVLGALAAAVAVAMAGYSWRIKRLGLPGNVMVALLASLPFLWGAWAAGRPREALPLVLLAAPLHLAREVAKDLDDAAADAPVRATLPVRYGPGIARGVLLGALLLFVAALVPFAAGRPRFAAAVLPVLLLSGAGALRACRGQRGGPLLLKSAMVCAIVALVVAR